jgi:hypothetical protein
MPRPAAPERQVGNLGALGELALARLHRDERIGVAGADDHVGFLPGQRFEHDLSVTAGAPGAHELITVGIPLHGPGQNPPPVGRKRIGNA